MIILLAVIGIMISAIMPLFISVMISNKSASYYSEAYKAADTKIEYLRSLSFEEMELLNGTNESLPNLPDGNNMSIAINDYEIDGIEQNDIKEVTVTINWNFKSEKTYTTSTLITQGGIGRWKKEG